jgi:hypothetical protein
MAARSHMRKVPGTTDTAPSRMSRTPQRWINDRPCSLFVLVCPDSRAPRLSRSACGRLVSAPSRTATILPRAGSITQGARSWTESDISTCREPPAVVGTGGCRPLATCRPQALAVHGRTAAGNSGLQMNVSRSTEPHRRLFFRSATNGEALRPERCSREATDCTGVCSGWSDVSLRELRNSPAERPRRRGRKHLLMYIST